MDGVIMSIGDLVRQFYNNNNTTDELMEKGLGPDPPEERKLAMTASRRLVRECCGRWLVVFLGSSLIVFMIFAFNFFVL